MRSWVSLIVAAALLPASAAMAADLPPDVASLVAAERAFAKASVTTSMRDAFLANLAESGIVFRPEPVRGREYFSQKPASPVVLDWEPVFAEVAASGSFGYTTGPWTMRPEKGKPVDAWGHFVSIWSRTGDGPWKVLLDVGTVHDPLPSTPAFTFVRSTTRRMDVNPHAERGKLFQADQSFVEAATAALAAAFAESAAADVRLYRMGSAPHIGRDAAVAALGGRRAPATVQPVDAQVAPSGDLGYTYGAYRSDSGNGNYLRIWRFENNAWKIVLDLDAPLPPRP